MTRELIVWPMIAQVLLTAVVWVRMYVVRVGEMRRRGIRPQSIATSRAIASALDDTAPADNFRNLFEVPVLFFAVCLVLLGLDLVTMPQLALAWAFVVLRCAHSFVQLTSNRVMHRFKIYVLGTLCVFAMWVVLAFQL